MKAMMSHEPGGPDSLKLTEAPTPEPGPGQIRIAVKAAGVNFPDTLIIRDMYQFRPPRPFAPGGEAAGVVEAVGGEVGMERYTAARSDVFSTGRDGSFHSNRAMGQLAGHYAVDMFIGASLQIDVNGNSSTVSKNRVTGFGGRLVWDSSKPDGRPCEVAAKPGGLRLARRYQPASERRQRDRLVPDQ